MTTALWQLIRNTNDMSLIDANIDKLSTQDAVRYALINNKLDIATYLVKMGVPYDDTKLRFRTAESIAWAKQHNIDITLNQVAYHTFDLPILRAVQEHYPSLLQLVDAFECTDDCLSYLLSNCKWKVDTNLAKHILIKGYHQSFIYMLPHISIADYKQDIAKSSLDIAADVITTSSMSIDELGMDLFTGIDIYAKIKRFSSLVPDFATKAEEMELLQSYIDDMEHNSALYLIEHYNMFVDGLTPLETAKDVIRNFYSELIESEIGDEVSILRHKQQISRSQYDSVTDLIKDFDSRKF